MRASWLSVQARFSNAFKIAIHTEVPSVIPKIVMESVYLSLSLPYFLEILLDF